MEGFTNQVGRLRCLLHFFSKVAAGQTNWKTPLDNITHTKQGPMLASQGSQTCTWTTLHTREKGQLSKRKTDHTVLVFHYNSIIGNIWINVTLRLLDTKK